MLFFRPEGPDLTQDPVIKNFKAHKNPLLGLSDGASSYVMLYVQHAPGESSPDHVHPWEHQAFITEGAGILVCGGKEFPIQTGDAVLVPGGVRHQFRNTGATTMSRVTVNPSESVKNEGRA